MMSVEGWLLDAYIQGSDALLWVKTSDGEAVILHDRYRPCFYLKPKLGVEAEHLRILLEGHPNIAYVEIERKFLTLQMSRKMEVLKVEVDHPSAVKRVISDLEKIHAAEEFFNADLLHIQQYLFRRNLPPTCRLKAEYDSERRLRKIDILNDEYEIRPPPFTKMIFKA
ncbi:TPA: hypothetical protein EYP75_03375 [Candidatus Bathyarchaeota archaeon]|nr:hypothetical protein [Candidatus Bathyarchaeota archaeon]